MLLLEELLRSETSLERPKTHNPQCVCVCAQIYGFTNYQPMICEAERLRLMEAVKESERGSKILSGISNV